MKRIVTLLIAICVCASCLNKPTTDEKIFYVSILPLRNIVQEIVGNDFEIKVLVPAGASPETFEPSPKQFVDLNSARMIFSVGLIGFEKALLEKVKDNDKIIPLNRGIELIEGDCAHGMAPEESGDHSGDHSGETGHVHAHGVDPHIWTSPRSLKIMAENAFEAIRACYPDSVKYQANFEKLIRRITELDDRVQKKIQLSGIEYFIVYHPALTYYARDYGIRQVAIEADGKEPSARRVAEIIRNARKDGVKKIFYQNQFPQSVVEVIARDMQAQYIEIDPLEEQVIDNIDRITDAITEP